MESGRKLGVIGRSSALFLALVILTLVSCAVAQNADARSNRIKSLFDQQQWAEVIREVEQLPSRTPDLNYYYGTALAQLGRWDQARQALLAGRNAAPEDKRFPVELGGVAFKQKRYPEAAKWLRRALRLDPADTYTNEFLATVYFLQGNLEAALKYWNNAGKPQVENVNVDPGLRVDPALLDRAFVFSPASTLRLPDLLTSEMRVDGLDIFPTHRFDLSAREDGQFDLNFHAHERNGFGENKWTALLSAFRGLPYETVYVDYFNAQRSARNLEAMVRWDDQKRRLAVRFSAPLEHNPKYRWQLGADLRDELWSLRSSFNTPVFGGLNLRREALSGGLTSFASGRLKWSLGGEFSNRQFRNLTNSSISDFVLNAYQLKQLAQLDYVLWRLPERRLTISSTTSAQTGAIWSTPKHTFEKLQAGVDARWFPRMAGDDYAIRQQVRAGKVFGQVPFDELFMIGLERDNDLWMRAHTGTRDGRKGSAPLGRGYFLANWEIDKTVYHSGLFAVKLSPFLDTGTITDEARVLGSHQWLVDTGVQLKFSVLGVGVTFIYGKDLRTGNNAFYATTSR